MTTDPQSPQNTTQHKRITENKYIKHQNISSRQQLPQKNYHIQSNITNVEKNQLKLKKIYQLIIMQIAKFVPQVDNGSYIDTY